MGRKSAYFQPGMFVPSKHSDANEKASFANNLMDFVESGFEERKFTKALYQRLTLSYGFIAHYNREGFWSEYFTRSEDKAEFLARILRHPCHGDPDFTYSDVEKAVQARIRHMGFHGYYAQMADREREYAERALLTSLQAKYSDTQSVASTPLLPVQAPLTIQLAHSVKPADEDIRDFTDFTEEGDEADDYGQFSLMF